MVLLQLEEENFIDDIHNYMTLQHIFAIISKFCLSRLLLFPHPLPPRPRTLAKQRQRPSPPPAPALAFHAVPRLRRVVWMCIFRGGI